MGGLAWADEGPAAAVTAHFAAIEAQDYTAADKWFSVAFLKAFKPDVAKLNEYYLARTAQLARGYDVPGVHSICPHPQRPGELIS